jgi:hypothetical protein
MVRRCAQATVALKDVPPELRLCTRDARRLERGRVPSFQHRWPAFDELLSAVHATGVAYAICSGTLLGLARHGGYIPWDDDVDVYVLLSDFASMLARLRATPRVEVLAPTGCGAQLCLGDCVLDIFVLAEPPWKRGHLAVAGPLLRGRHPTFCMSLIFPKEVFPRAELLPFSPREFRNMEVLAPADVDAVLARTYAPNCRSVAKLPASLVAHGLRLVQRADLFLTAHINPLMERVAPLRILLGVPVVVFYRVVLEGSAWFLFDFAWWARVLEVVAHYREPEV